MNLQDYKDVYVFAEQRDGVIQNVARHYPDYQRAEAQHPAHWCHHHWP